MNLRKLHTINSHVLLICILLEIILPKPSFVYECAVVMSRLNLFVFCIIIGWVVNDYLKNKFPEDESLGN